MVNGEGHVQLCIKMSHKRMCEFCTSLGCAERIKI